MLYGKTSVDDCAICVSGGYCEAGSAAPTICPRGYYCVAGLAAPMPCPIGTFGNASALRRSEAAWKSNLLNLESLCGDPREEKHTRPKVSQIDRAREFSL